MDIYFGMVPYVTIPPRFTFPINFHWGWKMSNAGDGIKSEYQKLQMGLNSQARPRPRHQVHIPNTYFLGLKNLGTFQKIYIRWCVRCCQFCSAMFQSSLFGTFRCCTKFKNSNPTLNIFIRLIYHKCSMVRSFFSNILSRHLKSAL